MTSAAIAPRSAFEQFANFVGKFTVITDVEIEGQHFDRKEIPVPTTGNVAQASMRDIKEEIRATVSAFSNSNADGGLLVIGISRSGEIVGLNHLTEAQRSDISNIGHLLRHSGAKVRWHDCVDRAGQPNVLMLIYAPETTDAICETTEANARAWKRAGPQNLLLSERDRDQIRRDKGIESFERRLAGRYESPFIDHGLLAEIRKTWPELANVDSSDERLLRQLGAIEQGPDGELMFTNAGLLFFASNPQRVLPQAAIRILRFDAKAETGLSGSPTLDRTFSGSLTHQLIAVRQFLRESGLFRVYHVRNDDGALVEVPELPFVAVDEAIVNAVAHRDYALEWQIECIYFTDAFVVRNAGRVIQRQGDVPENFNLDQRELESTPRNPIVLNWLKQSRDQKGQHFVRMLSEGTRAMLRAMRDAKLPPPEFQISETGTSVTLRIDTARYAKTNDRASEFANLYAISSAAPFPLDWRRTVLNLFRDRLRAGGWFIDRFAHGRIKAHRVDSAFAAPGEVHKIVRLFPAFEFAFREFHGKPYLIIDYLIEVKNVLAIDRLEERGFAVGSLIKRWATSRSADGWHEGRIEGLGEGVAIVWIPELDRRDSIPFSRVIPHLSMTDIKHEVAPAGFDIWGEIKRRSFSTSQGASRRRADITQQTAKEIAERIFPLKMGAIDLVLASDPIRLEATSDLPPRTLNEPLVEFARQKETSNIREGITSFGAYSHDANEVELVPIVAEAQRSRMQALIERLKSGKFKYRGAERTFGVRFTYSSIVSVHPGESAEEICGRLLSEHPSWIGDVQLRRLFLVHTPESQAALDDEQSSYYRVKRLLLEAGIPCQMVDTPTIENPDYKDLNLALNIAAKCGVVPWVLPEGIPDADFFIGLSYTQHRGDADTRLMGYANVFNRYGRWLFYSGNVETFAYVDRSRRLAELVESTLQRLGDLSETPHIYFHYSARFSREDREALVASARRVRPKGTYSFVWVNSHHPVRLYDERPESDGSLARGSYIVTAENQLYLSTTGYNPYRKALGTPLPLEITVWTYPPEGQPRTPADLHALARQILALTKLNWASSDALTGEPITTKYAGEIAYLTAAFLRQRKKFDLHSALEKTPWFL